MVLLQLLQQSRGSAHWGWLIAQRAAPPHQRSVEILITLAIVAALAMLVVIVALIIRRIVLGPKNSPTLSEGFSLSDLRQLHREGQITDTEFAAAKTLIIARSRSDLDDAEPSVPGSGLACRPPRSLGGNDLPENFSDPDSDKNSKDEPPSASGQ